MAKQSAKQITEQLLSEDRARHIAGFEELYIITMGNEVYSVKSKRFLKKTQKDGEFYVVLRKEGKTHKRCILDLIKENFTESKKTKINKKNKSIRNVRHGEEKFVVSCSKAKSFKYENGKKVAVGGSDYKVLCKNCLHYMVVDSIENLTCPECGNS